MILTIKERRFGIVSLKPLFDGVPDVVQMHSYPQPCRVRVRGLSGDDVWLDGKLFVPALPDLPLEFRKVRIVADFLEIVITASGTGNVTLLPDRNVHRSLPRLRAYANVLKFAEEGALQIQIGRNEHSLRSFSVNLPIQENDGIFQQLPDVVACLEKASAGVLPADLTISLLEIRLAWNAIVAFNGMVSGTGMKAKFTLDRDIPANVGKAMSILLYDYVDIGSWTFMAVVRRPILEFDVEGASASFECGAPRVVEAIVRRGSGENYLADLREVYARARGMERGDALELNHGDYRSLTFGPD